MKASIRSFSSLFANYKIWDIDSALHLVNKHQYKTEIENKSELLPTVINNLQDFIRAFEIFSQFKARIKKNAHIKDKSKYFYYMKQLLLSLILSITI